MKLKPNQVKNEMLNILDMIKALIKRFSLSHILFFLYNFLLINFECILNFKSTFPPVPGLSTKILNRRGHGNNNDLFLTDNNNLIIQ